MSIKQRAFNAAPLAALTMALLWAIPWAQQGVFFVLWQAAIWACVATLVVSSLVLYWHWRTGERAFQSSRIAALESQLAAAEKRAAKAEKRLTSKEVQALMSQVLGLASQAERIEVSEDASFLFGRRGWYEVRQGDLVYHEYTTTTSSPRPTPTPEWDGPPPVDEEPPEWL